VREYEWERERVWCVSGEKRVSDIEENVRVRVYASVIAYDAFRGCDTTGFRV